MLPHLDGGVKGDLSEITPLQSATSGRQAVITPNATDPPSPATTRAKTAPVVASFVRKRQKPVYLKGD